METAGQRLSNAHAWHVLGVGSIGGLFAARFAAENIPVTLLLRNSAALAAYRAGSGLRVEGPGGARLLSQPAAGIAATLSAPPVLLLVATKSPDTLDALSPLLNTDGDGHLLLLAQNGMGMHEQLRARWPGLRLWNAVTTAGVWRASAFDLRCVARGETHAGRLDDGGDATLDRHVHALATHGLLTLTGHIRHLLWRKLAINAAINALTALHNCRNGALLENPAAHAQLIALANEVEQVAAAEGIVFDEPLATMAEQVARLTADNFSSMNRDAAAGRKTEIDFINGFVVACAARHGMAVPMNAFVLNAVHALPKGFA